MKTSCTTTTTVDIMTMSGPPMIENQSKKKSLDACLPKRRNDQSLSKTKGAMRDLKVYQYPIKSL